eukprot:gene17175-18904_t
MAENTRTTIMELAARVGELSSAIAQCEQSDGISSGRERSQASGNNTNVEQEISHLFRRRNAMPTTDERSRSTFIRPSPRPSGNAINPLSSPALSDQAMAPIYAVRRNFGGRSLPRRKQRSTPKRPVVQGPFLRDIVLLSGPNNDLVPRQSTKLWLSEHGHVMSGIELQKQWTSEQVVDCLRNAFDDKLTGLTTIEILMSVHTKLLPPTIAPGQSLNGMMVFRIFKEKPIYVRPSDIILLNPPKKRRKFEACDTDSEDVDEPELPPAFDVGQAHFSPSDNQDFFPGSSQVTDNSQGCAEGIASGTADANHSAQTDFTSISRNGWMETSVKTTVGSTIQASSVIDLTEEYNALLNISFSDDEDEREHLILNNNNSPASNSEETIENLLFQLTSAISNEQISKFNVSRNHIWESARRSFGKKSFSANHKVSVKFTDDDGLSEGAVDLGGPTQEFFNLLLNELQKGSLFEGKCISSQNITCYTTSLNNGDYRLAGKIMAMSIVHGGPAPGFFSPVLFNALAYGPENISVGLDDVADQKMYGDLVALKDSENKESIEQCLDNLETITNLAGINTIVRKADDKLRVINDVAKWYVLGKTRPAFEELKNGLSMLGIMDAFRSIFCYKEATLSSESFEQLFQTKRSEAGSNYFIAESRIIMYWRDYLQEVDDKEADSSFGEILAFSTGSSKVPPLGFIPKPSIEFLHSSQSRFPQGNTCGCVLKLPTMHTSYQSFKDDMDFAFKNCHGFGMP